MKFYKAKGNSGFTLYAETDESLYCEIHHPSGDVGDVQEVSDQYPIERIKGQFDAQEIDPDEIGGLFGVKGQILDTLESADGETELDTLIEQVGADPNTVYGAAKHLRWDGLLECDTSAETWRKT